MQHKKTSFKNITLKLSQSLLRKCRHLAVEEDKSVSQFVADLISSAIEKKESIELVRKKALHNMSLGLKLGGKPLSRDEIYEA